MRRLADKTVERLRGHAVSQRLLTAVRLHALDDLDTLLPQPVHLHELLRRMLQVAVDHGDTVTVRRLQAGKNGSLLAEIARKMDAAHGIAVLGLGADLRPGGVARAVVDKDQFVRNPGARKNAVDLPGGRGDHFLLIKGRDHNRKHLSHLIL